ncbi:MAG: pyruvate dehydrogenase (acetyl-transferring) E1 component subunit alpha [Acidimicrobiales bacterium]|nr:MAG: pyruvate dehydrogenase (acetyl-transferring) E1 component subunit alpha [Acidimicrobiales bacterium]
MADSESFVQLLTPSGHYRQHNEYAVDFTPQQYRDIYRDLVIVRRLDAEATALQRQGELGLWASLLGQEAAQVGSGRALQPQDVAFPSYREHGVAWCRGLDPIAPLRLFRGVDHGAWDPADTNFHLYTIVIGSQTLHATGYAMGVTKDGQVGSEDGAAVITYFGDGATSQGDLNEALIWASGFAAPVVFFCQNNQYAISAPSTRQSRIPLYLRAAGFGLPGIQVDGNDVLACYSVTQAALRRARLGEGPTFIEAYTYRMAAHTTSDDASRYRPSSEVELWQQRDPIARYRAYLEREQLADAEFFADTDSQAQQLALKLRAQTLALPDPPPRAIFDQVYAEPSAQLAEQQEKFAAYLDSFADNDGEAATAGSQGLGGSTS